MRIASLPLLVTVLVSVVLCPAPASAGPADDYDRICAIVGKWEKDPNTHRGQRAALSFMEIGDLELAEGTRKTLKGVAQTVSFRKYAVFVSHARHQGVPGWSCPPLRRLFEPAPADSATRALVTLIGLEAELENDPDIPEAEHGKRLTELFRATKPGPAVLAALKAPAAERCQRLEALSRKEIEARKVDLDSPPPCELPRGFWGKD